MPRHLQEKTAHIPVVKRYLQPKVWKNQARSGRIAGPAAEQLEVNRII